MNNNPAYEEFTLRNHSAGARGGTDKGEKQLKAGLMTAR